MPFNLSFLSPVLLERTLNVLMRLLAMGSRFALIFIIAKFLEPADVGLYGIFFATVGFGILVIGGDYYTYSQRELMSLPRERWSFIIQHQIIATALLYLILIPPQFFLFTFDLLPSSLMLWFFIILAVEHISQEMTRLLIVIHRQLAASFVLFLRLGLWVWVIVPLFWFFPETHELEVIFLAWFVGGLLSILVGGMVIFLEIKPWRFWSVDKSWIQKGFKVGFLFLFATMCFKALMTVDRFVFEELNGIDLLAVYVLYMGMAMSITMFLDAAVISFLYPRMVSAYRQGNYINYDKYKKEMFWSTLIVSFVLAVLIVLVAPFVLDWIGRSIYVQHIHLLWLLVFTAVVYSVGMIPHYGLYARGADRGIVVAHVTSLLVFAIVTALLANVWPLYAIAYGLIAAFAWMGGLKFLLYMRLNNGMSHSDPITLTTKGNS